MADISQLETALRNADAAGDVAAAKILAAEIMKTKGPAQPRGVMDKLTGATGPRYQLWPERLARGVASGIGSALTLPGEVVKEAQQPPPAQISDSDVSTLSVPRTLDFAGIASPVNPAVRAGDKAIPGVKQALVAEKKTVPTAQALKDAAEQGYTKARDMGVEIKPDAVVGFGRGVQADLEKDGVFGELAPKTFSILKKLQSPPEGSVATFSNLDAARKALGHAASDFTNKTEQLAAKRVIDRLDDFLTNVPAKDVLAGPAASASKAIKDARGNYAAAMRSNKITGELDNAYTGILDRGELNAAVANSGQNVDNAIRQRLKSLLSSRKEIRGYNPEEIAQMEKVARGTVASNTARMTGNLLGGGGGLGASVYGLAGATGAIATGNPVAAALSAAPIAGYGLKKTANALTKRQVNKLDELIRTRSPLFQDAAPNMTVISPEKRAAVVRALLMQDQQQ